MRTLFDRTCRTDVLARLDRVQAEARPRWGRMSAPRMVVHLGDQMRMTLGSAPWTRMPGLVRYPGYKQAALYWLPWPKSGIQGPPEAFLTAPTDWDADRAALVQLVERLAARGPEGRWPDHSHFGSLSGRQWGVFCYRHFDHHLRQFDA